MSIKALIMDSYGHPVSRVIVTFRWESGVTTVKSDHNGIADPRHEDALVSIQADGKTHIDFGSPAQFYRDVLFKIRL